MFSNFFILLTIHLLLNLLYLIFLSNLLLYYKKIQHIFLNLSYPLNLMNVNLTFPSYYLMVKIFLFLYNLQIQILILTMLFLSFLIFFLFLLLLMLLLLFHLFMHQIYIITMIIYHQIKMSLLYDQINFLSFILLISNVYLP